MLLEDHTKKAINSIKRNGEPVTDLIFIRDAMLEAAATGQVGKDEKFRSFLYKTIGNNLANRMAKERSTDMEVSTH